jgi:hypothetical protein
MPTVSNRGRLFGLGLRLEPGGAIAGARASALFGPPSL